MDDPEVNAAYDANHTSVDEAVRLEAFKTVPLYTAMAGIGANKDLAEIEADAMGNYNVYDWSWAE